MRKAQIGKKQLSNPITSQQGYHLQIQNLTY